MAKKILIAIDNEFQRETYKEIFRKEGFVTLEAEDGKKALALAQQEKPNIILADTALSKIGGLKLLTMLKKGEGTKRIPVIIFAQFMRKWDRTKAIELDAEDYISTLRVSPSQIIWRVKIALGEQKTYRIEMREGTYHGEKLIKDLGYQHKEGRCKKCNARLVLHLMRDLSKGGDYFKVSFICPSCLKKGKGDR